MSLFHKKDDIPEIPTAPEFPKMNFNPEEKPEIPASPIPSLPSMPGDTRDQINRDMIKSAIEDSSEKIKGDSSNELEESPAHEDFEESGMMKLPELPKMPETKPKKFSLREQKTDSVLPEPPTKIEIPAKPEMKIEDLPSPVKKDAEETIFVRIDKFNSAKRDVGEIVRELREVESVLAKIEQIKMQEDEEVAEVSKVMEEIKLKMNRIDSDVFNRL